MSCPASAGSVAGMLWFPITGLVSFFLHVCALWVYVFYVCRVNQHRPMCLPKGFMAEHGVSALCEMWQQHISCRYSRVCANDYVVHASDLSSQHAWLPSLVNKRSFLPIWTCMSRVPVYCQLLLHSRLLQVPRWLRTMRLLPCKRQLKHRCASDKLALCALKKLLV
jgi:hypothetical protein